jgi:nucleotide-binding universal stress UspA family protein
MQTIVVGYDDSEGAKSALAWAIDYAKERAAHLRLVYVVSSAAEWELAAAQIDPDPIRLEVARRLEGEWSAPVRAAGLSYATQVLVGRPADKIMQCARESQASLIVVGMGTHGTLAELFLGSPALKLLHHAIRPVVAVPAGWEPQPSAS